MDLFDLFVTVGFKDEASKNVESLSGKLQNGLKTAAKVGAAAVAAVGTATAAAGKIFADNIKQTAAYADNIDKMSQKMGLSAEAYQEWDFIMQHSGTSIESLQAGMKTLANAVDSGNDAFERLGISQEQIASMNQEELFSATITALQGVENETERTYLAGQLLGRGATELGALLNTSAEDMEAMRQQVHELGGVMSDEAVKAGAQFQDSLQNLQTAISGFGRNLSANFLPSVSTMMDGLSALMIGDSSGFALIESGIDDFVDNLTAELPKFLGAGAYIVESLLTAIMKNLPKVVESGATVVTTLINGFVSNLPTIFATGVDVLITLIDGIIEAIPELIDAIPEVVTAIILTLADNFPRIVESGGKLIAALINGLIRSIPQLVNNLPQIIKAIVSGLMNGIGAIADVGVQLVRGLWEGIKSMASWIGDRVSGFFGGIVDNVKEFLGIHSPSRVFAGIGKFMAEGLGEGWDEEYSNIRKSIENGFDLAVPNGQVSVTRYGNNAAPAFAGAPITIPITLELDGAVLARKIYSYNQSEVQRHGVSFVR